MTKTGVNRPVRFLDMNLCNARHRRTRSTGLDHSVDRVGASGKDGLDRTIAAIANPADQAQPIRFLGGPGAVPNPLNFPLYPDQYRLSTCFSQIP